MTNFVMIVGLPGDFKTQFVQAIHTQNPEFVILEQRWSVNRSHNLELIKNALYCGEPVLTDLGTLSDGSRVGYLTLAREYQNTTAIALFIEPTKEDGGSDFDKSIIQKPRTRADANNAACDQKEHTRFDQVITITPPEREDMTTLLEKLAQAGLFSDQLVRV